MITHDGIYVSDRLSDEEMWELLSDNITLEQLTIQRTRLAEIEYYKRYHDFYYNRFIEKLNHLTFSHLRKLQYNKSNIPYSFQKCINDINNNRILSTFEQKCATTIYYEILNKLIKDKSPINKRNKAYRKEMAKMHYGKNKSKNR